MAAVQITISGILYDKYDRTGKPVTLVGEAILTGLSVGGGPIYPPEGGHIPDMGAHPEHPIYYPPGTWPGQRPPHPAHPIVLPPDRPPVDPPTEPPTKPPDPNWEWGWSPTQGWLPVYVPGDKPQPPGILGKK